jgi:hypothetical protein
MSPPAYRQLRKSTERRLIRCAGRDHAGLVDAAVACGTSNGLPAGPSGSDLDNLPDLDPRGRRIRAALVAVLVRARAPELALVHRWLDTWSSIGLVVVHMAHQGYQVSLGEHGTARRIAVFYRPGRGHESVLAVLVTNLTGELDDHMMSACGPSPRAWAVAGYGYVEKTDGRRRAQVGRHLLIIGTCNR